MRKVRSMLPKDNTGRKKKRRWMLGTRAAVSREISNAAVLAAITVFTQTQIVTSTSTAQHSTASRTVNEPSRSFTVPFKLNIINNLSNSHLNMVS